MKNNNKKMMFDLIVIAVLGAVLAIVFNACSYEDDAERWQAWTRRETALCRAQGGQPVLEPHWSGQVYKECILPNQN